MTSTGIICALAIPLQLNAQTFIELSAGELDLVRVLDFEDSCVLKVEPLAISGLITRAQYQEFLEYYWSVPYASLPDSNRVIHFERDQKTHTDLGNAGGEAATDVTWVEAVAYCQWLTGKQVGNKEWVYRLPMLSEWLFALDTRKLDQTSTGCWLQNAKDEALLNCDQFDYTYSSKEGDPGSLRRKMAGFESARKHPEQRGYYEFIPYPAVGFRVVRVARDKR